MTSSLQVIASPRMGGAEMMFARLAQALAQRGQPTIAAVRRRAALVGALGDAVAIAQLPMAGYFDLRTTLAIRRLVREHGCGVVQTWMSRATWLTRAPRGCLHVARIGGYYRPRYFRHAHAWVTPTRTLRDWMVQAGFAPSRVAWLPNFVPQPATLTPPFARADLGIPQDALLIVALGRFIDKKGFGDLLGAFTTLPPTLDRRPLHLLLMGRGPAEQALRALARAGGDGRVHITGWVSEPVAALRLGDIFVCPSREEAHGNVMLEAWMAGLPVISTRSDGGRELIEDGRSGLLCDIADPAGLAAALRRLGESAALRAQLAGRGREVFHERHGEQAVVAAWLDFYARMRRHARY